MRYVYAVGMFVYVLSHAVSMAWRAAKSVASGEYVPTDRAKLVMTIEITNERGSP